MFRICAKRDGPFSFGLGQALDKVGTLCAKESASHDSAREDARRAHCASELRPKSGEYFSHLTVL